MEVLCINDNYTPAQLKFFSENSIVYPKKDKIYNIYKTIRTFKKVGVYLEEIKNPVVPINGATGLIYIEPNFKYQRFSKLNGDPLNINELLKINKDEKEKITISVDVESGDKLHTPSISDN